MNKDDILNNFSYIISNEKTEALKTLIPFSRILTKERTIIKDILITLHKLSEEIDAMENDSLQAKFKLLHKSLENLIASLDEQSTEMVDHFLKISLKDEFATE